MAVDVDEAVLLEEEAAFFLFGAPEKVDFFGEETTFPSTAVKDAPTFCFGLLRGRLIWVKLDWVQIYTGGDPPIGD